jgi:hypothetical protein
MRAYSEKRLPSLAASTHPLEESETIARGSDEAVRVGS